MVKKYIDISEDILEKLERESKFQYKHFFISAKEIDIDSLDYNLKLITSLDELKDIIKDKKDKLVSYDCETTGLTYFKDKIVGFSFSFGNNTAYYVPIRHKEDVKHYSYKNYIKITCDDKDISILKFKEIYDKITNIIKRNKSKYEKTLELVDINSNIKLFLDRYKKTNEIRSTLYEIINLYNKKQPEYVNTPTENLEITKETDFDYDDMKYNVVFYRECVPLEVVVNLPVKETLDVLYYDLLLNNNVILFNSSFDLLMLKGESSEYNPEKIRFVDVMNYVYYADTNWRKNGLKWATKHFLGYEPPSFTSVLEYNNLHPKKSTFDMLHPEQAYRYASYDAIGTYRLYERLSSCFKDGKSIISVDNKLSKSMLYYMTNKIYIDDNEMLRLKDELIEEIRILDTKIFKISGSVFNISSTKQLIDVLEKLKININNYTKTGKMSVSASSLETVEHPIAKLLVKRNHLKKQLTAYVDTLSKQKEGYIQYKLQSTASGRLASGNPKGKSDKNDGKSRCNDFFLSLNFQNLTKPCSAYYTAYETDKKDNILGWDFLQADEKIMRENPNFYYVEGFDPKLNIRKAISRPNDNWLFVSVDYEAQEIKLAGIFSGEQSFIKPYKDGGDGVHEITAYQIWGKENYNKEKRKMAKNLNFSNIYGGTEYSTRRAVGCPLEEAVDINNNFWKAKKNLRMWVDKVINIGIKNGSVNTLFGRPRRFLSYFDNEIPENMKWKLANAVKRYIPNFIIQGTGADIMRLTLVKLYNEIFKSREYEDEIRFVGCVHDEIDYLIHKDHFDKWVWKIKEIMEYQDESWPLKLTTSVEVGRSYGELYPFEYINGKWSPKRK